MPVKKNILVVGYPKSGTVWATRLVAQIIDCPSKGFWALEKETPVTEGLHRESDFECFHSHHSRKALESASTQPIHSLVYVIRDPRDIAVSGAFDFMFYYSFLKDNVILSTFDGTLFGKVLKLLVFRCTPFSFRLRKMLNSMLLGNERVKYLDLTWAQHVNSYIGSEALIIKYEDLLGNCFETSKKILAHLSYSKCDEQLMNDITNQSFAKRKEEFINSGNKVKAKHLREGKSGQWRFHLSEKQNSEIERLFGNLMSYLGYIKS